MLVKGLNRFAPLIPSGIQHYTNLLQKSAYATDEPFQNFQVCWYLKEKQQEQKKVAHSNGEATL